MDENIRKIQEIIASCDKMHVNDPRIIIGLEEIVEDLSENEIKAITTLEQLSKEELNWLTPWFEDLSARLQSHKLIACLEKLGELYPDIPYIQDDILSAKNAMDEE